MDFEMRTDLIFDGEDASFKVVDAQNDPVAWVERKLEENEALAFAPIAPGQWKARKIRRSRLLDVTVTVEGGFVEVLAEIASMAPTQETLDEVRIYQMLLNGAFRIRGFKMAEEGQPIAFLVRHKVQDAYDLNEVIEVASTSLAIHIPKLQRLLDGEDAKTVYQDRRKEETSEMLGHLDVMRRLFEGADE